MLDHKPREPQDYFPRGNRSACLLSLGTVRQPIRITRSGLVLGSRGFETGLKAAFTAPAHTRTAPEPSFSLRPAHACRCPLRCRTRHGAEFPEQFSGPPVL